MERALSWNALSLTLLQTTWLQVKLVSAPALWSKPKDHNIVFGVNYEIADIKSPQLDFRKIVHCCFLRTELEVKLSSLNTQKGF